ncbi:gp155 [Vibrio phage CKB-S1]|nr:gp155 [Vibrio phage CKB-S1]
MSCTVINMDCRLGMSLLPENSIDVMITDPPYGLSKQPDMQEVLKHWLAGDDYKASGGGFMGKTWDSFVPGPATWREAYRALKPGAYAAVFAGSRTVDLMSISLRLAGFEVVDMMHWLYGTGFPKGMDIAKAIDKQNGAGNLREMELEFTAWFRENIVIPPKLINQVLGVSGMASHYMTDKSQPHIATRAHFEQLRPYFKTPPTDRIEYLVDFRTLGAETMAKREVIGQHDKPNAASMWSDKYEDGKASEATAGDITKAHTSAAQDWEGWNTALKPAHEPIILARKPLAGTYADNVLTYGTSAMNIDACRVNDRWPANVLHDGCLPEPMDRYFYSAKATKADREDGLEGFEWHSAGEVTGGRKEGSAGLNSPRAGAGRTGGAKNVHPTVKPTELMAWLCKLLTPPGGTVLDPFTGSGSTGRGAATHAFNFLGYELDEQYAAIARARIDAVLGRC